MRIIRKTKLCCACGFSLCVGSFWNFSRFLFIFIFFFHILAKFISYGKHYNTFFMVSKFTEITKSKFCWKSIFWSTFSIPFHLVILHNLCLFIYNEILAIGCCQHIVKTERNFFFKTIDIHFLKSSIDPRNII